MHLSTPEGGGGGSRATHGNLTVTYIPKVGILIRHHVPGVRNFGMVAIFDNGESLEMSRHLGKYPEGIWMNFPGSWKNGWAKGE